MANSNELSCIDAVQQAPKAQKQSVFERACEYVKNNAQIALLAVTLGLATPAMAENTPKINPNYQAFHAQIVERYPKLSPEQHDFFATLYTKGLNVIDPKNEKIFNAGIRRIIGAAERQGLAIHIVNDMIEKQILSPNHPYTRTLISTTQEIDKMGQEKIQQANQKIQQSQNYQEKLKALAEKFENM